MKFSIEVRYKIVISLVLGMLGFALNLRTFNVFNLYNIPVNLFPGLYLPILLSLNWGWKYGMISLVVGIYPSMWIMFQPQGYGMIYLILIYTMWIFFHGIITDIKKNDEKKWYFNLYLTEFIFRIITSIGYFTIFKWFLSFNAEVSAVYFSYNWIVLTLVKNTLGAYILLLIAEFSLRFNFVSKMLKIKKRNIDKPIIISIFMTSLFLIFHTSILTFMSDKYTNVFFDNLFFDVKIEQLVLRLSVFILFSIISIEYVELINNIRNNEKMLLVKNDNMKSILQLTANIETASLTSRENFINELLITAMEIIPEASFGGSFIIEGDCWIPLGTSNKKDINPTGLKFKYPSMFEEYSLDEVFIISEFKNRMLEISDLHPGIRGFVSKCDEKESLFICVTEGNVKVSCIFLSIAKNSDKYFSEDSIELAKLLKNIPSAFHSLLIENKYRERLYVDMIYSILKLSSIHNSYTSEHSENVAKISVQIAKKMEMSADELDKVYWSALVHDIGKILVSENILNKKSKLTKEEYEIIKNHPVWGYETLKTNDSLFNISKNVLHHHERWDGGGYPEGLIKEGIPLISRIIAIADSYDAMTSNRAYRKALSKEIALKEINDNSGKQFDPNIVRIFKLIV